METSYGVDSYWAGYSIGQIIFFMFVTTEFDYGEEPLDPYSTLSNQKVDEETVY